MSGPRRQHKFYNVLAQSMISSHLCACVVELCEQSTHSEHNAPRDAMGAPWPWLEFINQPYAERHCRSIFRFTSQRFHSTTDRPAVVWQSSFLQAPIVALIGQIGGKAPFVFLGDSPPIVQVRAQECQHHLFPAICL